MDPRRYFDHAATTPVDPRVLAEMLPFFTEDFGNAHSIHAFGKKAEAAVELARQRVAEALGAEDQDQIVFTSGATEGNNWILRNHPDAIVSPFEHSSIRQPSRQMGLSVLEHEETHLKSPERSCSLVSVMAVNNETGSIWDAASLKGQALYTHSDLTQAVGKVPIQIDGLDFATISAHKFYGPKGVGALYFRNLPPEPLIEGGGQERGFRAGTLNVPGIVGMGVAAAIAMECQQKDWNHASDLRSVVLDTLRKVPDLQINSSQRNSPFILSVGFFGVQGEPLVLEADHSGYAISSGAACSSSSTELSPVLSAMGVSREFNRGTVRISFGRANTLATAAGLAASLQYSVEKLRTMT